MQITRVTARVIVTHADAMTVLLYAPPW